MNNELLIYVLRPLSFFNDDLCLISKTQRILIDLYEYKGKYEIAFFLKQRIS
jgi:hypothetical protein